MVRGTRAVNQRGGGEDKTHLGTPKSVLGEKQDEMNEDDRLMLEDVAVQKTASTPQRCEKHTDEGWSIKRKRKDEWKDYDGTEKCKQMLKLGLRETDEAWSSPARTLEEEVPVKYKVHGAVEWKIQNKQVLQQCPVKWCGKLGWVSIGLAKRIEKQTGTIRWTQSPAT